MNTKSPHVMFLNILTTTPLSISPVAVYVYWL